MLKRKHPRHRRSYSRSKYPYRRTSYLAAKWGSPHKRAIDRLALDLQAEEGLLCWFHSGVAWQALLPIIDRGTPVQVEKERSIHADGRRYTPDLTVRCNRTGQVLLLIEVWNTHAVSEAKRRAFANAHLPWIEVRAIQVLSRLTNKPLPVIDWGGLEPNPPTQHHLFECPTLTPQDAPGSIERILASWTQQLGPRFAISPRSWKSVPRST